MRNPYRVFKEIFPDAPLQVGTVSAVANGVATVTLPGGGKTRVRGVASAGDRVFVRDGLIEGEAPALPVDVIEI